MKMPHPHRLLAARDRHRPLCAVSVLLRDHLVLPLGRARCSRVAYLPERLDLSNYVAVFDRQPFGRNILNSIIVAGSVVAVSLGLGMTAAYAFGRIAFRGRALLLMTILGVSMFPQVAVLSGMFELIRSLGLYNTLPGLILANLMLTLPFTVWVLTTFMRELPKEIEEAALSTGRRPGSW